MLVNFHEGSELVVRWQVKQGGRKETLKEINTPAQILINPVSRLRLDYWSLVLKVPLPEYDDYRQPS